MAKAPSHTILNLNPTSAFVWMSPDPEALLQRVTIQRYDTKGQGGGISLLFAHRDITQQVYDLLTQNKSETNLNASAIRHVLGGVISLQEALCISSSDPRMLHVATLGASALRKIDNACCLVTGEHLPNRVKKIFKPDVDAIQTR